MCSILVFVKKRLRETKFKKVTLYRIFIKEWQEGERQ